MDLGGAILVAGEARHPIAGGRVRSVDAATGEVRGVFELPPGVRLRTGHEGLAIEGLARLELRLLSSGLGPDGVKRYRFVAGADAPTVLALQMLLEPQNHPTLLEEAMR